MPSHERRKYADCVIVRNDNPASVQPPHELLPLRMPKLAFAGAVETVARYENGTKCKSVLQADIKKARHFDVPGLMIDY